MTQWTISRHRAGRRRTSASARRPSPRCQPCPRQLPVARTAVSRSSSVASGHGDRLLQVDVRPALRELLDDGDVLGRQRHVGAAFNQGQRALADEVNLEAEQRIQAVSALPDLARRAVKPNSAVTNRLRWGAIRTIRSERSIGEVTGVGRRAIHVPVRPQRRIVGRHAHAEESRADPGGGRAGKGRRR